MQINVVQPTVYIHGGPAGDILIMCGFRIYMNHTLLVVNFIPFQIGGQNMSQSIANQAPKINTAATLSATQGASNKGEVVMADATKDAGRVHVGGSMIRF
jgi:hypothetical protein